MCVCVSNVLYDTFILFLCIILILVFSKKYVFMYISKFKFGNKFCTGGL